MRTRSFSRRTARALCVWVVVAVLAIGSANAQVGPGVTVNDPLGLLKQVEMISNEIKSYEELVMQYEQMLVKVQNLGTNFSLAANTLQPISDPSALINADCPSGQGGGLAGIAMSALSSLISQPLDQGQRVICAQIITRQVDKYNKTVAMLNKIQGYSGALQNLTNLANSISTLGQSNATTTQVNTYSSQIQTEMSNWEADMRADDTMIAALQSQQTMLANMALNGGGASRILGDALGDATFQTAINALP